MAVSNTPPRMGGLADLTTACQLTPCFLFPSMPYASRPPGLPLQRSVMSVYSLQPHAAALCAVTPKKDSPNASFSIASTTRSGVAKPSRHLDQVAIDRLECCARTGMVEDVSVGNRRASIRQGNLNVNNASQAVSKRAFHCEHTDAMPCRCIGFHLCP